MLRSDGLPHWMSLASGSPLRSVVGGTLQRWRLDSSRGSCIGSSFPWYASIDGSRILGVHCKRIRHLSVRAAARFVVVVPVAGGVLLFTCCLNRDSGEHRDRRQCDQARTERFRPRRRCSWTVHPPSVPNGVHRLRACGLMSTTGRSSSFPTRATMRAFYRCDAINRHNEIAATGILSVMPIGRQSVDRFFLTAAFRGLYSLWPLSIALNACALASSSR